MQQFSASIVRDDISTKLNYPTWGAPISLSTINGFVQESFYDLFARISSHEAGSQLFTDVELVTLTAETNVLDLVSDFTKPVAIVENVGYVRSTSEVVPIRVASKDEAMSCGVVPRTWADSDPAYRLSADGLVFYPTPASSVQIFVQFKSFPVIADDLSTVVTMRPGWRKWLFADVATKVRLRENKDPGPFYAERGDAWETIVKSMPRDTNRQPTVRDTRGEGWTSAGFPMCTSRRGF